MSILLRTVLYSICDLRASNNILSLSVKVSTTIIKLSQKKKERKKRERENKKAIKFHFRKSSSAYFFCRAFLYTFR